MNIPLDEVVYFDFVTSRFDTGAATDADSTPTFEVFEESTDTDIGVGGNATKRTSKTGNYRLSFTISAANGFEVGKWYNVIASATVNSVAGKAPVACFRVVAAEAIAGKPKADVDAWLGTAAATPTVAGVPEVDITHIGGSAVTAASGIPEVKVASIAAGAVNAAAIGTDAIDADSLKADAITEIQSGLATASALSTVAGYLDTEVAAILAAVDSEVAAILADTNELQTDLTDGGRLDLILDAINAKTTNLPSDPADASVIAGRFDTLDTAVGDIPTNADLATALAAADDAVLAAIAALNNLSSVQAQAAAAAALTATVADSVPADGTRPSVASGILMLTRFLFERVVTSTTVSVKKEDGTTESMTLTLGDATSPASITRSS